MFVTSVLAANESTLTTISFVLDDDGNLNPNIFLPLYYGESNQFYSAIEYRSSNIKDVSAVDGFNDSKNAFISSSKDLTLNYITYRTFLFGMSVSIGVESTLSKIENNEFGYIHDSADFFGNGTDYYISFDNEIELEVQRHAIISNILIPFGEYFTSRLSASISPFTRIGVKQSTIFKPLISETGSSSSSTVQDLAYTFIYEIQTRTDTFFNLGLTASYNYQPLKYDIAQVAVSGGNYVFETNTVDTNEITTRVTARVIFDINVIGDLQPSLGYGYENFERMNNLNNEVVSIDRNFYTIGFEKRF